MRRTKEKQLTPVLIVYCLLFFSVWTLRNIALPSSAATLGEWPNAILSAVIKLIIWVLPCLFLIRRYESALAVKMREMFITRVRFMPYLLLMAGFAVYVLAAEYLMTGRIGISPSFAPSSLIGAFLIVGITEELVFRGWLLNAMLRRMKPWAALSLNAVLFLLIHFPGWICRGIFLTSFTHLGFVSILVLSFIFGVSFMKSRNLLVPVCLHMFWDLLTVLFFAY